MAIAGESTFEQLLDREPSVVSRLAPLIPYAAVLVGMYWLSSGWAAIIFFHAGMVAVLTATRSWQLPSARPSVIAIALGLATCLGAGVVGPILIAVWPEISLESLDFGGYMRELGLRGVSGFFFILHYSVVNPILEELFWRGYLGSRQRRFVPTDLWFAGYHVLVLVKLVPPAFAVAAFVGLTLVSWGWRQVGRQTQGLLIPVLSHAVADLSIILSALLLM